MANDAHTNKQYRSYDVDETVGKFLSTRHLERHKSLQNLGAQGAPRNALHPRLERPSSANIYSQSLYLSAQSDSRKESFSVDHSVQSTNRNSIAHRGNSRHAPLAAATSDFARYNYPRYDRTPGAPSGPRERLHALSNEHFPRLADNASMGSENMHLGNRLEQNDRRRKSTMKSFRRLLKAYLGISTASNKKHSTKINRAHYPDTFETRTSKRNVEPSKAQDWPAHYRSHSSNAPEKSTTVHRNQPSLRPRHPVVASSSSSSNRINESSRMNGPHPLNRGPSFMAHEPKSSHFDRPSMAHMRQKSASCMTLSKRGTKSEYAIAPTSGSEQLRMSKSTGRIVDGSSESDIISIEDDNNFPRTSVNTSTPCLRGITNLGNTCYINSVLQCLSACSYLSDYFISDKFLKDLHSKTRAQMKNCQQYGTGGLLTVAFADIIKSLWSNDINERIAREFHEVVRQFNNEYGTFQQQDAQEFLVWLLDKIHEDLNTAVVRLYEDNAVHGSEEDVAESTRNNHLRAHCSIIISLFSAQFRSSINCQRCHVGALRFDPYMCVSLQVPQEIRRPVYVTVAHSNHKPTRLVRYGIFVDRSGRFSDVNDCISAAVKVPSKRLIMCELNDEGFCNLIPIWTHIERLRSDSVTAVELPQPTEISYSLPTELVHVIFLVVEVYARFEHKTKQRFTQPFACVLPRQSSFDEICVALFGAMRGVLLQPLGKQLRSAVTEFMDCRICVVDGCGPCEELNHLVSMPFYTDVVERAITANRTISQTQMAVLQLCVEVSRSFMLAFMVPEPEKVLIDQSCDILKESSQSTSLTLTECLDEFSSPECIEWKCENCGMNRGEKILKFRSLPPVLVFHLKRFRQMEDGTMIKLDRSIHFPVEGLDMSPYVLPCNQTSSGAGEHFKANSGDIHHTSGGAPISDPKTASHSEGDLQRSAYVSDECVYDLFAVVHHIGGKVNSGHYTASARNVVDAKWRAYDDRFVRIADPYEIAKCSNAYLLFYEKRVSRKQREHASSAHSTIESVEQHDRLSIAVHRNPSPSVSTASVAEHSPRVNSRNKVAVSASDKDGHYESLDIKASSIKPGANRTIRMDGRYSDQMHSLEGAHSVAPARSVRGNPDILYNGHLRGHLSEEVANDLHRNFTDGRHLQNSTHYESNSYASNSSTNNKKYAENRWKQSVYTDV